MTPNPKIIFVQSLLTSRIFWAQVISLIAMIATTCGLHPQLLSEENQAELVGLIDMIATTVFRLWGVNGPVSLTAPITVPAPQDLPMSGTSTVTVHPQAVPVTPPPPSVTVTPHPPAVVQAPLPAFVPAPPPVPLVQQPIV